MADMPISPDAFSSLLSDPRALSAIADIMSSLQNRTPPAPSEPSTEPVTEPPPPPPPPSTPDLSGMLGAALSNPELLSALPSVISMLSGMGGGGQKQPPPPSLGARSSAPQLDRRCALLNALKPYLPEDKRSAVDTVVRVIEIMSLIK